MKTLDLSNLSPSGLSVFRARRILSTHFLLCFGCGNAEDEQFEAYETFTNLDIFLLGTNSAVQQSSIQQ